VVPGTTINIDNKLRHCSGHSCRGGTHVHIRFCYLCTVILGTRSTQIFDRQIDGYKCQTLSRQLEVAHVHNDSDSRSDNAPTMEKFSVRCLEMSSLLQIILGVYDFLVTVLLYSEYEIEPLANGSTQVITTILRGTAYVQYHMVPCICLLSREECVLTDPPVRVPCTRSPGTEPLFWS
jgi:hypothetical protein